MMLRVERSTPLVLLQDAGRFGVRHLGLTQGGALDWISMSWANWLLGNALDAPVIEIPLGSFSLISQRDCHLALAGADLDASLDGQPLRPWRSFTMGAGQCLSFRQPRVGARAYLAAPGGFDAPPVMGSCATVVREKIGGLQGSGMPLKAGDKLDYAGQPPESPQSLPEARWPDFTAKAVLDVVLGAQIGDFTGKSLFDAFNSAWTLDARSDRMGVRLLGARLQCPRSGMISEGIPLGAVQVPPDGQPIVLLNDRQTIGGYPRIGTLTPQAVARLAQCLPGSQVWLKPCVQQAAQHKHLQLLEQWRG